MNIKIQNLEGAKILMVEDNEMNQLIATQFLNKWNAEIDYAPNGEIAIELVQRNHYDLVLMDLEMPVMNGYETTRKIRSIGKKYSMLPIIALTTATIIEVKDKVYKAGMNDYITKPFHPQELYAKINKNLEKRPINLTNNSVQQYTNPINFTVKDATSVSISIKRIIDISGGNKQFIKKYTSLAAGMFTDFPKDYQGALLQNDVEKLRKIHHNIRATIGLLELHDLEDEIQRGRKIMKDDNQNSDAQTISINNVKKLCIIYLKYIQETGF